jgi:hypothetical protein
VGLPWDEVERRTVYEYTKGISGSLDVDTFSPPAGKTLKEEKRRLVLAELAAVKEESLCGHSRE